MKYLIILAAICACSISCKKDNSSFTSKIDLEQLNYFRDGYYCTATKEIPGLGNIKWTANAAAYPRFSDSSRFDLLFRTYQDTSFGVGDTREVIQLSAITSTIESQLINTGTYARRLSDGDVQDGFWPLDSASSRVVEILEINKTGKYLRGRFSIKFKQKTQGFVNQHSENIHFLDAEFTAKIIE
jgi:hypothetical protein